jgi:dephospho-CoA kinase
VRRLLEDHGIETIDADAIGHAVLEPDGPAFADVAGRWPEVVVEGVIDRRLLATVVFNDPAELKALESVTHPHIFDAIRARVEDVVGPVVVEVPLLTHRLGSRWKQLIVDSRDSIRHRRALARGMSREDTEARMMAQPSRSEWLAAGDLVVPNHGSRAELNEAVVALAHAL